MQFKTFEHLQQSPVQFVPILNADSILLTQSKCPSFSQTSKYYDPANSTWVQYPAVSQTQFKGLGAPLNGQLVLDHLCPQSGWSSCSTAAETTLSPVFYISVQNCTYNSYFQIGTMGLAPTQREGYKSYTEILLSKGLISKLAVTYVYNTYSPQFIIGAAAEGGPSFQMARLASANQTFLYGTKVEKLQIWGETVNLGGNIYLNFEPALGIDTSSFSFRSASGLQNVLNTLKYSQLNTQAKQDGLYNSQTKQGFLYFTGYCSTTNTPSRYLSFFLQNGAEFIPNLYPNNPALSTSGLCIAPILFLVNENLPTGVDAMFTLGSLNLGSTRISYDYENNKLSFSNTALFKTTKNPSNLESISYGLKHFTQLIILLGVIALSI